MNFSSQSLLKLTCLCEAIMTTRANDDRGDCSFDNGWGVYVCVCVCPGDHASMTYSLYWVPVSKAPISTLLQCYQIINP